ncbi:MAG: LPXTG cell wall anchor domain-containing protein [Eubacterium sp.]|nr:LPXTG cell wall anchor domain-containing protein [Eubacterium sp.]
MKAKRRCKRILAFALAVVMICGMIPSNVTVANAATTATVSLSSLGRKGNVTIGSKTKSGTWWQMHLNGKKAFCINLGYTCHSGNTYAAEETYHWNQDTSGKNGYYAKVIRWYVIAKKRSNKGFVMSQALIWSIAEGRTSESQLKDVIKEVQGNINISTEKSVNELYKNIFEPDGEWTADITFWKKTGNSKRYQQLLTVDADKGDIGYDPLTVSDRIYYRQRITIMKKDEDGKGVGGIQFTLDADDLDYLYSFSMSDRDGVEANTGDDDNDTSFSMTGYTKDSGRIAYRMTYKLETMEYYYYPDSQLEKMSADEKKAAKKYLTDEMELDEGVEFASDMTKASAQKMMDQEMKNLKNNISNTYTLTENSTGDNKHIVLDPEYAAGKKITLKKANSWEKNSNGEWPDSAEEVPSEYSGAYITGVTNKYKKATVNVIKVDNYSNDKKAHGDASLDGAEFQLYADAACTTKATVYNESGTAKTAGVYTTKNAELTTDYLRSGCTYYLKEITAPKGYLLSHEVLPITVDASEKEEEYTFKLTTKEIPETPVLGKVAIRKYFSEGQTGMLDYEINTTFQVYLTEKKSYDACDEYERAIIKTGDKGYGISGELYYGDYTVHQVDSGGVDAMRVDDFSVAIRENGQIYEYAMDNIIFKAYLRILKKDGNTEKQVLKPGTAYQIYRVTDDGEKLVEQTYSNGNKQEKINRFVTDETGEIMTVKELKSGIYRIYEVDSATGLHITEKYIEVPINSEAGNYESFTDEDGYTHAVVTVTYTNAETYGKLKVYKTGEMLTGFVDGKFVYENRFLKGAEFEIIAAEDIVTQDNQGTHWYDKGEVVATITTGEGAEFEKHCKNITGYEVDEDGTVTVNLPLGKYHIKEIKAVYGYVIPDKGWDVEFNWKNKDEEYVLNATDSTDENGVLRVENERANARVSLFKTDAATKRAVEGAEFGIFTRHDIYNVDGEKIVDAGAMLGMVKTDADGRAIADIDFPLMDEDYVADTDSSVETDKTETIGTPDMGIPVATTPQPKLAVPTHSELVNPLKIGISPVSDTEDDLEEPDETEESETTDTEEEPLVKLNSGDYFFKELSVSGSYYMDGEREYPVHLEYKDQDTEVVAVDVKAENTQTSTTISKTAVTNSEELAGCDLQITDAEGNVIAKWTSGSAESIVLDDKLETMGYRNVTAVLEEKGAMQINGLFHGTTYTLTETRPADGYVTADSISFQLVEGENKQTLVGVVRDGNVTLQNDNIVRMVDDTTKVEISKTDITGSEEIPGCELEIKEKDTDIVLDVWTSTEEKHLIQQKFVVGKTYVLTEKRPADGYVTADSIEFTIEDTGEIQSVSMRDETTKIRLIKLANDTGQGLRGAKFEVYDSQNKKVLSFTSREEGYDITGKLAVGETYTFREVEAPKGYRLAKPVKYTVKDTGEVQEISVTDKKIPKPEIPQTGGTTPFAAVAVLFFVLGSGGLFMVRRKKRAVR